MEKKQSKPKIFNIKKVINQKKWTKEEDEELRKLVKSHNGKKWKEIASNFHNKSPLQCFSRYKRIRPEIYKGSWKKEEDKCLNISDINKKSKEKKDNNQKNDTINRNISSPKVIKKLKTNRNINIRSYTTKNYSKINHKRNSENKYLLITKDIEKNSKRMKKKVKII